MLLLPVYGYRRRFPHAHFLSLREEQSDIQSVLAGLVIYRPSKSCNIALIHFIWIYFYSAVPIAEYLQLCGYVSLTGVQAITVHGFNGESSTENKRAHDLRRSLGLAEHRASKELHVGICRSSCLATGLEGGL